jgi:cytochrome c oxidase subunit 3
MPANTHLFFAIYYCMTGLHGIHVLAGMVMLAWLIWRGARGDFSSDYFTPVDVGGLYWHIVDLVWIFLFPLFYLIH